LEIADRNDFKRQVCAGLGHEGGQQLEKLVLQTQPAVDIANEVSCEKFRNEFNAVFPQNLGGIGNQATTHAVGNEFELDLCLKFEQKVSCAEFFAQFLSSGNVLGFLPTRNGFQICEGFGGAQIDPDSYLHFEITQPSAKIVAKLFQLEFASRLAVHCVPKNWGSVSAVGLFVNGGKDEFLKRAGHLKDHWNQAVQNDFHITRVPFYLIYTPFLNVYSGLRLVLDGQARTQSDITAMKSDIAALQSDITALTMGQARIENLILELLNKVKKGS
jgi:hypothetical protein